MKKEKKGERENGGQKQQLAATHNYLALAAEIKHFVAPCARAFICSDIVINCSQERAGRAGGRLNWGRQRFILKLKRHRRSVTLVTLYKDRSTRLGQGRVQLLYYKYSPGSHHDDDIYLYLYLIGKKVKKSELRWAVNCEAARRERN